MYRIILIEAVIRNSSDVGDQPHCSFTQKAKADIRLLAGCERLLRRELSYFAKSIEENYLSHRCQSVATWLVKASGSFVALIMVEHFIGHEGAVELPSWKRQT